MAKWIASGLVLAAFLAAGSARTVPEPASPQPAVKLYRLAKGFVPETMDEAGMAKGATGFAGPNRWGQYTAYLMKTDGTGERTWRIEHYLPLVGQNSAQGSTMYLLEGRDRALLIDTANPATFTPGVNDLKTVVRYLLGHGDDGRVKAHPLDFVVANTHNHGDHIGENALMSDRTIYYMDGDWPANAPANYVPIREGGGVTPHGRGVAVGSIDLGGGRVLAAIAMPPHTAGSTGYLDAKNHMLFTGDAIGSAWPWLQFASIATYDRMVHHVEEVTRPYPDLLVLPAHFYQLRSFGRSGPPLEGHALDRRYILDQVALADGLLSGELIGSPYPWQHSAAWATRGSAKLVYSLDHLADPDQPLPVAYHAMRIAGGFPRAWTATTPPPAQDIDRLSDIQAEIYLIRQAGGPSLYLVKGSASALLIGTGSGAPGLAGIIHRLAGALPLDVALLDGSEAQTGGLASLSPRRIYVAGSRPGGTVLADGDLLSLGLDGAGRPLTFEAQSIRLEAGAALTLREIGDRLMFAGAALGRKRTADVRNAGIEPFRVEDPVAYQAALSDWSSRTIGRFDNLLVTDSADWYLSPDYVTQLEQALTTVNTGKGDAVAEGAGTAATAVYRSDGDRDVRALIVVPGGAPAKP